MMAATGVTASTPRKPLLQLVIDHNGNQQIVPAAPTGSHPSPSSGADQTVLPQDAADNDDQAEHDIADDGDAPDAKRPRCSDSSVGVGDLLAQWSAAKGGGQSKAAASATAKKAAAQKPKSKAKSPVVAPSAKGKAKAKAKAKALPTSKTDKGTLHVRREWTRGHIVAKTGGRGPGTAKIFKFAAGKDGHEVAEKRAWQWINAQTSGKSCVFFRMRSLCGHRFL